MADTQAAPATDPLGTPTDRPATTGLPDLDALPPLFTADFYQWPLAETLAPPVLAEPGLVDSPNSTVAVGPGTPTESARLAEPVPIPAVWPGVVREGDKPRSDPEVAALASSSYSSGGSSVQVIASAKVTEVDFVGDAFTIEADPGTDLYPSGPEYQNPNGDDLIDLDAGEWAGPVGYPRNTKLVVTAKFKTTWETTSGYPGTGDIYVRGYCDDYGPSSGIMIPETKVSATADKQYIILPPTESKVPLYNCVQYNPSFGIRWQFMHQTAGQSMWREAGASVNELYVNLAAPTTSPVYHTPIHLTVPVSAAVYAKTDKEILDATWQGTFTPLKANTRHIKSTYDGKPMTYYHDYNINNLNSWKDLETLTLP